MYHVPASVMIRREILNTLADVIRDINATEISLLNIINK